MNFRNKRPRDFLNATQHDVFSYKKIGLVIVPIENPYREVELIRGRTSEIVETAGRIVFCKTTYGIKRQVNRRFNTIVNTLFGYCRCLVFIYKTRFPTVFNKDVGGIYRTKIAITIRKFDGKNNGVII